MHPRIHVAAVSLFSTTRFPLSVDPNDKFASSHFSNYAFIFPRVVKRFRTISFSKRWLEERGKSRKSRSILIIPLFALANPSVWIVTSITMRARVQSRFAGIFRLDVGRRDSRHWPTKLCDAGDPRFREVERACRAVTRMEEFRRARAFHEVYGSIVQTGQRFRSPR